MVQSQAFCLEAVLEVAGHRRQVRDFSVSPSRGVTLRVTPWSSRAMIRLLGSRLIHTQYATMVAMASVDA